MIRGSELYLSVIVRCAVDDVENASDILCEEFNITKGELIGHLGRMKLMVAKLDEGKND